MGYLVGGENTPNFRAGAFRCCPLRGLWLISTRYNYHRSRVHTPCERGLEAPSSATRDAGRGTEVARSPESFPRHSLGKRCQSAVARDASAGPKGTKKATHEPGSRAAWGREGGM